jgi:hypothetical protein
MERLSKHYIKVKEQRFIVVQHFTVIVRSSVGCIMGGGGGVMTNWMDCIYVLENSI